MVNKSILYPVKIRKLSPEKYLAEVKKDSMVHNIQSVKFIPPKLSDFNDYGLFEVTYKNAVLVNR